MCDTLAAKPRRIFYLDLARAFAIVSITCNHAVNRAYSNYSGQQAEFESLSLAANLLKAGVSVFSRIGVPIFLMITGVLILSKRMQEEQDFRRFYRHNWLSLLITTELWYVIMYFFILFLDPANHILEKEGIRGAVSHLIQTVCFQNQVTMGSMWYMPMILGLYTLLPFVCAARDRIPRWALWIPMSLTFLICFVRHTVNAQLNLMDMGTLSSNLKEANLLPAYMLYILLGWLLSGGLLKKVPTGLIALGSLGMFAGGTLYQLYAYSMPENYLVSYYSLWVLFCAVFTFELLRRIAPRLEWLAKPISRISKDAFAIYFVHILIMSLLHWSGRGSIRPSLWMVLLEAVSFIGSLIVIWLLKKIPCFKKYLFLIKD